MVFGTMFLGLCFILVAIVFWTLGRESGREEEIRESKRSRELKRRSYTRSRYPEEPRPFNAVPTKRVEADWSDGT